MAKQALIPGKGYINLSEDGKEKLIPGLAYLNEAAAVAAQTVGTGLLTGLKLQRPRLVA